MILGKRYYKTKTLTSIRLLILAIVALLLFNLYRVTFSDPDFIEREYSTLKEVIEFHLMYPENLILFGILILFPAYYYAFHRGTVLKEKGLLHNLGLPFLNKRFLYSDLSSFKVIHPEIMVGIYDKNGNEYFIVCNDINRVIGILDQHGVQGNLDQTEYRKTQHTQKLVAYYALAIGLVVYLLQHFEVARHLFRFK